MASSKNESKITLPSFRNALSFASGDFYGGSTTLSASFSNHKSSFLGYKMVNPWHLGGTRYNVGVNLTALVRFTPSGGLNLPPRYRLGCHGLTYTSLYFLLIVKNNLLERNYICKLPFIAPYSQFQKLSSIPLFDAYLKCKVVKLAIIRDFG